VLVILCAFYGGAFFMGWSSRKIAFIAISVCLSLVIEVISSMFFRMPQGGSFSLVAVPLIILGYRYGVKYGIIGGTIVGVLQGIFVPPYFVNFFQYFLEYILAFAFMGMGSFLINLTKKESVINLEIGVIVSLILRYLCHVIAGVLFFAEYAGDQKVIIYSLSYNAVYMAPTIIITLLVAPLVFKAVSTYLKMHSKKTIN